MFGHDLTDNSRWGNNRNTEEIIDFFSTRCAQIIYFYQSSDIFEKKTNF